MAGWGTMTPTAAECRKMVAGITADGQAAALAAVRDLGPASTAQQLAVAEAALRAAADTLKRAQAFLAQWP